MLLCYSTFFVALLEKETFPHSLSDCKLCRRRKIAMPLRPEGSSAAHRSFARVQPVQSVQKGFIHRECKARGSCSLASQSAWGSQMNLIRKLCTTSAEHPLPPSRDLNLAKQARNLWPKRKRNKKNKNCAQPKPQGKIQKLSGKKRRRVEKKMITALGIFLNLRNSFPKCVRQVPSLSRGSELAGLLIKFLSKRY